MAPSITIRLGERRYRHLWLKYVSGADLSRHCAVALHGRYSRAVDENITNVTVELNEFPHAIAWYLCGVTTPYRWKDNPHLALEAAPGHTQDLQVQDLTVHLDGVRPIPITDEHIPGDDPRAANPAFRTCRNWWFAHYLVHVRSVPDVHGDRPRVTTTRPGTGQGELIPAPQRRPRPAAPPPAPTGEPRQAVHQPPIDAIERQVATDATTPQASRTGRIRP
ncbi:hypothetical protein GCM10009759_04300 [Kitasatospora saccharophila]|uniref:Uncharacterized protein n=1 Tax=Kitasatospora saccharophila TaxID=407973 RepID=A0ABN2W6R2_9ACTN